MPKANVNNIEIEYETIGNPTSKPLLLIAGLGSQLLAWSDEMCEDLVNRGFFVIRFDNRDIGLSTKFEDAGIPDFTEIGAAYSRGEKPEVPYTLEDMADDAVGLLDALNIDKAHILGASMGGMIAQVIAYRHSSRVLSLTVIMSTTGNPELPPGKPAVVVAFFEPVPSEREAYIEEMVKRDRLICGTFPYDEERGREYRTKEYDRSYYPSGSTRQLAALFNIKPKISAIQAPTLVIHGSEDPFYPIEVAKDIATTIPGAKLLILDGMGHNFPNGLIPRIIDALVENSNKISIKRDDMSQNDQIFQHFISLTFNHLEKSFSPAEAKVIHSSFTKRFTELYEKLKKKNKEKEIFFGLNPIFVIALEESLPAEEKEREKVIVQVLAIYRMMLEDFVLEPQRRFMSSSKDPWSTFTEDTRKGNLRNYDNECFKL
ncbi:MAG: alpha/beta fold hydrolase, partial [Candidatus Hermodarchaeota archaeon]